MEIGGFLLAKTSQSGALLKLKGVKSTIWVDTDSCHSFKRRTATFLYESFLDLLRIDTDFYPQT